MERGRQKFEQLALAILEYFECDRCCKCCLEMPIHLNDADLERIYQLDGAALFDKMDENEVDNYLKRWSGRKVFQKRRCMITMEAR